MGIGRRPRLTFWLTFFQSHMLPFVMPPTSKKFEGHIASGVFVRPSFRHATVLKFLIWIPHEKIADTCFIILTGLCPFPEWWPVEKNGWNLVSKISKKLLKLEPWNLMNRLVVMSRLPDYILSKFWKICLELWPFEILGIFTLSAKYLQNC